MTLRILQVGMGGWGRSWAGHIVAQNKDVETVAWVDVDKKTLEIARQELNLPEERCFTSLEAALTASESEAVLITASLPGHVPCATASLLAGKHVLMEKPFAPTVEEAQSLVDLSEQQGCILMISQNYRYAAAARAATQLVRDGALGDIAFVSIDFRRFDHTAPFETHPHYKTWEPLLSDMSIHHFDLMRLVLGQEPIRIFCQTWNPLWSKYVQPPAGAMTITFDGGTVVSYRGSWISTGAQTNWAGDWHMEGEYGELIWTSRGEQPEAVTLHLSGEKPSPITLPQLKAHDRAASLETFVQAVQSGVAPETSGRDNLQTLKLMFAAIESARTGLPATIA